MVWFKRKSIIVAIFLIIITWFSTNLTNFHMRNFANFSNAIKFVMNRFFPIEWSLFPRQFEAGLITLAVAFLGSFFALLIAIPFSFLAAHNTNRHAIFYGFTRTFLSILRSVPEIVFGLILVVALGLGPFPAVLAIILHNIGVLGKLISELIESADQGPQDAMKAVGATSWVAVVFSILPQIWPNVLSHFFYRFEVAIRTSLILGFIGGGGLGQLLFNHFSSFYYTAVALDIIMIMALVIIIDFIGGYVRKTVI
ncbi:phosphonate ABC transporter, permease protein PhnE [Haloplasma contractile]|uniref:Phosphonates transport system permease protein phnE n=1 Tax=Haloplasma contractile SSD-17B TaxID=1033810 RepID=F7PVV8_9MOLU|nr:phosphonate ABC transporter, permease protein PhnE [Haloplasma contractile]ERJ12721.1 Phosphonates transport system permease protein phnE [Haloplasma contractile SSD-17B]